MSTVNSYCAMADGHGATSYVRGQRSSVAIDCLPSFKSFSCSVRPPNCTAARRVGLIRLLGGLADVPIIGNGPDGTRSVSVRK
jgi:hypothetical protein